MNFVSEWIRICIFKMSVMIQLDVIHALELIIALFYGDMFIDYFCKLWLILICLASLSHYGLPC